MYLIYPKQNITTTCLSIDIIYQYQQPKMVQLKQMLKL